MSNYYRKDDEVFFDPYDEELIQNYLIQKIDGKTCGDFIVMKDVYAKEPWLLDHNNDSIFKEDQWYYFVTRTQVSEKNIDSGQNAKRMIIGDDGIDRGSWRSVNSKPIINEETRKVIGIKKTLIFIESNKKKQRRGDGTCAVVRSDNRWIMKEYMLPEGDRFQKLAICKIYKKKKKSKKYKDDNHEASTSTYYHQSSSSEHQPISDHESIIASSSSSEQQQPLLCGGKASEIPHIASPCAEGDIVHQIDEFSFIDRVSERASEKEDWIGDLMDLYTTKGIEAVLIYTNAYQRQQPISAPAHMNVPQSYSYFS